jgi:hypothetical protein
MGLQLRGRPQSAAEEVPDALAELRPRYAKAIRKLASALLAAAAANAALEELLGSASLVNLKTRGELPAPWVELRLQPYMGAETRLMSWLRFAREKGFL